MKLNFKNNDVYLEECAKDHSIKLGKSRIGNILPRVDGNHLKCRSQAYADLLPVKYKITNPYEKTRGYKTYITIDPVNNQQIEEWVDKCVELGIDKCLDNRG